MMPTVFIKPDCVLCGLSGDVHPPTKRPNGSLPHIPFTSPFLLPFRLPNETVPAMDIVISLVLLIICIAVVALLSIRIYSASVLHYGQRLKLKDITPVKMTGVEQNPISEA